MFQIVVPAVAAIIVLWQLRRIILSKATWKDVWPSVVFSLLLGFIALFPDTITMKLAKFLDFESNINAILFALVGILFVSIIRLYDMYRKQQRSITKLTQELSILMAEGAEKKE